MEIYQPAEDSYLLQKYVQKLAFGRVLDLGTGSGIQALTAVKLKNVPEVVAVDINKNAVAELKEKVKVEKIRKIKVFFSDLFSQVEGKFDTIIFNPPYLPQDKINQTIIEDPALYGGDKGWEISKRFFDEVNNYLTAKGQILFLFSNLTNKKKIEEIIKDNLLEFEELEKQKLPFFEELYVYVIKKSQILRNLEQKGIAKIHYLTQGKRGEVFRGEFNRNTSIKLYLPKIKNVLPVAIKIERKNSTAKNKIENEINWLKKLNQNKIGPKFILGGEKYFVMELIKGEEILTWIKKNDKMEILKVITDVLKQCFSLDQLKVDKEEMHHPLKHIIINELNQPTMIDFERCHHTDKPKNLTQFVEFICRMKEELAEKKIIINKQELRKLAQEYKERYTEEKFKAILSRLN